jgi:PhzF family phenazine biosynthesis protein
VNQARVWGLEGPAVNPLRAGRRPYVPARTVDRPEMGRRRSKGEGASLREIWPSEEPRAGACPIKMHPCAATSTCPLGKLAPATTLRAVTCPISFVDVFCSGPLSGNPLAVVFDADRLTEEQMRSFARWINLSETTFVLRPTRAEADYRLRIFTPAGELAFAGHPTLGTCQAWLQRGGQPKSEGAPVQECALGLVQLRQQDGTLAFAAPPLRREPVEVSVLADVLTALGLGAEPLTAATWLDNGTRWLGLLLNEPKDVLSLQPDHKALASLPKVGVIAPYPAGSDVAFEVRAFAASAGVLEDPVTGSLNASFAQWLTAEGRAPARYQVAQGQCLKRAGRVQITVEGPALWVGGNTKIVSSGTIDLPIQR